MSYVKRIAPLAAAALFVYCLLISEQLAESSRLYLELCGRQVVPSLFVFSVLGGLVSQGSGINLLCKILPRWGTETAVGALGLCGGVPLGPVTALKLYRDGDISKRQAEYLCTFSCTPSLSFPYRPQEPECSLYCRICQKRDERSFPRETHCFPEPRHSAYHSAMPTECPTPAEAKGRDRYSRCSPSPLPCFGTPQSSVCSRNPFREHVLYSS